VFDSTSQGIWKGRVPLYKLSDRKVDLNQSNEAEGTFVYVFLVASLKVCCMSVSMEGPFVTTGNFMEMHQLTSFVKLNSLFRNKIQACFIILYVHFDPTLITVNQLMNFHGTWYKQHSTTWHSTSASKIETWASRELVTWKQQ
jgi:hypothetical protein